MDFQFSGTYNSSRTSGVITGSEVRDKSFKSIYYPNSNPIITVSEPKVRSSMFSKHVLYWIVGIDSVGKFETQRRYKEFFALRKAIVAQWPGCSVPQVPPKQSIGNLESSFVEGRRSQLEYFVRKIALVDFIYSSEEFQSFLRGPPNFHKSDMACRSVNFRAIGQKYQNVFSEFLEHRRDSEDEKFIGEALGHMNQGIYNLESVSKLCSEQSLIINQDTAGISRLIKGINDIKTYLEDPPSTVIIKNIDDPFIELRTWCNNSALMISGIIESIFKQYELQKLKSTTINKIELEKEKIKSYPKKSKFLKLFQKKPTEFYIGKSEAEINSLSEIVESIQLILDITSALIIQKDYPTFKIDMKEEYFAVLKRVFEKYESTCSIFIDNFKLILI